MCSAVVLWSARHACAYLSPLLPLFLLPHGFFVWCCCAVQVSVQSLVGMAQTVLPKAVAQPISLEMPASHVAAALVTAGRKAAGLFPVWPKCLMVMTGLLNPQGSASAKQLLSDLQLA